jgi:uncharacterized repeat protein (TIGR04076 family)
MHKTIDEDWEFTIKVIKENPCRMGFEIGDTFTCKYECPTGFCPKTMATLHTLCDVARSGGDYMLLGGKSSNEIDFFCADGAIRFHLAANKLF